MRTWLAIIGAGLVTFVVIYALLEGPWSRVVAEPASPEAATTTVAEAVAPDSLAPHIAPGNVGIGVPTAGSEPLLRDVHAGDRLNVLASVAASDGRPVTAVVVSGARVLQPSSGDAPLLLEVSAEDGIVLAHLVLEGARLSYAVLPAAAAAPPPGQAIDEAAARATLGLAGPRETPAASGTPAAAAGAATSAAAAPPAPAATAAPATPSAPPAPQTYTVAAGDTLDSIAAKLDVDPGALWWANRGLLGPGPLPPGLQLSVPTVRGFLYQVQPGDTWDSIGTTFGLPSALLRDLNQPGANPPEPGALVFIPRP